MPVITITSDWKNNDFYIGAIKGQIISACPDAVIVDISHEISDFNIQQAAFVVRNCYQNFPEDTIHMICVKSESKTDTPYILIKKNNHYFLGADNGLFSLLFSDEVNEIYQINVTGDEVSSFPELSVLTKAAIHVAQKKDIKTITKKIDTLYKQVPLRAVIDESAIIGSVIYIDSYKNAITNISKDLFQKVGKDKPFEIFVQSNHYKITRLNQHYVDTSPGELLALFNSVDLLEIAINNGNAAELLNLSIGSNIRVKFK